MSVVAMLALLPLMAIIVSELPIDRGDVRELLRNRLVPIALSIGIQSALCCLLCLGSFGHRKTALSVAYLAVGICVVSVIVTAFANQQLRTLGEVGVWVAFDLGIFTIPGISIFFVTYLLYRTNYKI